MAIKTTVAVCEHMELYNMTLYTTGLCYEHFHNWYKAEIMILLAVVNERKPPFLLTLLANANGCVSCRGVTMQ